MKILIAYDGSTHADAAIDDLQWAGLPRNAEVIVLTAVDWPIQAPRSWGMIGTGFGQEWTGQVAAAEQLAESACLRLQKHFPQWVIQLETPTGNPATVILEKANAWPADLIVAGTHGRAAIKRVVLGSVSLRLVREARSSVRVARPRAGDGPIRLLIGNDGSPEAEAAIEEVCRRSWPAGTEARVLAAHEVLVPANAERLAVGELLYDMVNKDERVRLSRVTKDGAEKLCAASLAASPMIAEGDPKEAVVREARNWNADTIFIGARGLGRVERLLLGSVSSATVAHASCTVEVVRHR